jgi:hypothetical protein
MFEFQESKEKLGSIPLRTIVRHYTGMPNARQIPAQALYFVLGRLRCLAYTLRQFNDGVVNKSAAFEQYWKRRALDYVSGFGFQVKDPNERVDIVGLEELIKQVEQVYQSEIEGARELISGGQIDFDGLAELYRPERPVQGKLAMGGVHGVFMVVETYYQERRSLLGMEKSFHCTMEFVVSLGEHFSVARFSEVLSGWTGVRARPICDLLYEPVSDSDISDLKARGDKYVQFGSGGPQFLAYSPNTFFLHPAPGSKNSASLAKSGSTQLPGSGRVMIDSARGAQLGHVASQGMDEPTIAMTQLAQRYKHWKSTLSSKNSSDGLFLWDSVPEELRLFCWPALVGFSFTAKAWGHVIVSGLSNISFYERAFDQLVLAPERKQLIRALVRFGGEQNEDIIGGKSGGSVFLLHGPPGVGKTLTAEAISEVLKRPLYYVSMGELGMSPEVMEQRLGDILELCAHWNALTLLDEADVFLETRATSDIVRNAMVCVMLRLLEYHPGILFLTTNRVRSFDPAFESRVTVALRYDSLEPSARCQIWKNLIHRLEIPLAQDIVYEKLANHSLNGRQIKNAVRLAVALAKEMQTPLSHSILETTLSITQVGRDEMKNDDSWKG